MTLPDITKARQKWYSSHIEGGINEAAFYSFRDSGFTKEEQENLTKRAEVTFAGLPEVKFLGHPILCHFAVFIMQDEYWITLVSHDSVALGTLRFPYDNDLKKVEEIFQKVAENLRYAENKTWQERQQERKERSAS